MSRRAAALDRAPRATLPSGRSRDILTALQVYVILGATVSLLGWILDVQGLADWDFDGIVILPNTCVAAIAAGAAVLAVAAGRHRLALALGAFVAGIGGTTLLEYAGSVDLGIDRLLMFGRTWGDYRVSVPGRMGIPAATAWTTLGVAVVLVARFGVARPALRTTAAWLAIATTGIAMFSLIAYLYGASALFSTPAYTAIALQTATFVLCASLGLVLSIPERGPMPLFRDKGPSGVLARRLLPAIVALPILVGSLSVLGLHAGWYDVEFGIAIRTVCEIALLVLFLWWSAGTIRHQSQQRARADAVLLQRERELGEAQRLAKVGSWQWDARTDEVVASEQMYRMYGLPLDRPFPRASEQKGLLYPVEVWDRLQTLGRESLRTGRPFEADIEALRGSERFMVAVKCEILVGADGHVTGARGTTQDLSDRIDAESERRDRELLLRSVTDHAQVGLVVLDREHRYVYANRSYATMLGLSESEILGRRAEDVLGDRRSDELRAALASAFAGERTHLEYCLKPLDETMRARWLEVTYEPQPDETGHVPTIVVAVVDVTERKEIEAAREQVYQREHRARAEAERAVRIKDEFLATLSHELRTPLNAILGWAQILRHEAGDPQRAYTAAEVIERNGRLQAQLITDLLDMSRIMSGKMRIEMQSVDVADAIDAAIESMQPAARAKDIAIERDCATRSALIQGDPGRLQQVVWNLLSNAVKFTPRGGHVRVELAQGEGSVEIRVHDDGKGIPPEFLPHMFERFSQADSSTSRAHGGLGIGLALVKQIVELHGGRVHAASQGVGRGATFVVELPLAPASLVGERTVGDASRSRVFSPESTTPGSLQGITALVVDDEADAVEVLQRLLRACGAHVVTALSAEEALERIEQRLFDVVISDIGMPGADGYELLIELRKRNVTTPAVALTAFARPEDRAMAESAGFQAHLAKPVDAAVLVRTVAEVVGTGTGVEVSETGRQV